jgi:hypothetical protein
VRYWVAQLGLARSGSTGWRPAAFRGPCGWTGSRPKLDLSGHGTKGRMGSPEALSGEIQGPGSAVSRVSAWRASVT